MAQKGTPRKFSSFGPLPIEPDKLKLCRVIGRTGEKKFQDEHKDLLGRVGCYVFAIRASKGFRPWYVGKATKSFAQEIFTPHKCRIYNDVLADQAKGTPVLFLLAPDQSKGPVPTRMIDEVESYLITIAAQANPELKNIRKRKKQDTWRIPGVVNSGSGKLSASAKALKRCLSL